MDELKVIENDLVPVYETDQGEKVVYGTELYAVLGVKSRYNDWARNRLSDCDATEDEDYQAFTKILVNGGRSKDYIIKLDTAKEMAMLERNEIGKRVRKYFIDVEKRYKQVAIDRRTLSPQMQMFYAIADEQAKMELEQKRQAKQLDRIEKKQDAIAETFSDTTNEEDFKAWVNRRIGKIAESSKYTNGASRSARYQNARAESYERLNQKRPCRLTQRVAYAKEMALQNGATKTAANSINNLTIIAADKDLRPIYETVVKEMMIFYCVSEDWAIAQ